MSDPALPSISVIVPVYKEEAAIRPFLARLVELVTTFEAGA